MNQFTDIHHHLVYGIDDGPRDFDEMAAMLHVAHDEGCRAIIATPHVAPGIKAFDEILFRARLKEAQDYCDSNNLNLRLFPGAEVLYTPMLFNQAQAQQIPTLADTRCVLIEFMPDVSIRELEKGIELLVQANYRPILAHIERYRCIILSPHRLIKLKQKTGLLCQVNSSTIIQPQSFIMRGILSFLLTHSCIDIVASDAHNTSTRLCKMKSAYRKLAKTVGDERARDMTNNILI